MERRACKLCSRTFSNGRALGGHMRSHMAMLSPSPHNQNPHILEKSDSRSSSSPSAASTSSHEPGGAATDSKRAPPSYDLRENPTRSFRFADPDFSFAVDAGSVIHDGESETEESSPKHQVNRQRSKKQRVSDRAEPEPEPEPEPVSSVSDAATEEDVALCLMMLSRDAWMTNVKVAEQFESQESREGGEGGGCEQYELLKRGSAPGRSARFQCETCGKVFRSYQALGGHRASHGKIRSAEGAAGAGERSRRIHQCPICLRIFSSGQALGGHRRSHLSAPPPLPAPEAFPMKFVDNSSIDLNLPAPPSPILEPSDGLGVTSVFNPQFIILESRFDP